MMTPPNRTAPADTRIALPYPPSVNSAFRKHNGKHLSEAYRKWRDEAGWMLKAQRPERHEGQVSVLVELTAPDQRRRDIDNAGFKAVLDLLKAHSIIQDDDSRFVREVTARWVEAGEPCIVTVRAA